MEEKTLSVEKEKTQKRISLPFVLVAIMLFILSITSSFFGGYHLNTLLAGTQNVQFSATPSPTSKPNGEESPEANSAYMKDKQYFDDTVIAVTDNDQPKILVATATRQETSEGANQATRVSYFDGQNWTRKTITRHHDTNAIYTNEIITSWNITIDPSRVLKQRVQGVIQMDNHSVSFDTGDITNNIAIRSLPGYTKFMSTGYGTILINGETYPADIVYTRIYSNNSSEIQFYNTSLGLTTHWLAFWDTDGNFYHVDATQVAETNETYQTHKLGILVDTDGRVSKTFQVSVNIDTNNPPQSYQIHLGSPINQTLHFSIHSSINKAPNGSYSWFMSDGVGQVDSVAGRGLVEYIHH